MVFHYRPHQGRLSTHAFLRVHCRPAVEKKFYSVQPARSGGGHEGGFSARIGRVGIRPGAQQCVDHGCISIDATKVKRRHAVARRSIDFCARANQQLSCLQIILTDCPMKGGHTVGLGRVHVDLLLEQRANRISIRSHHCVRQASISASGVQADSREQYTDPQSNAKTLLAHKRGPPERLQTDPKNSLLEQRMQFILSSCLRQF